MFVFQETTITEIKQKIMKIPEANGIVIDGFPRDVGQALSFEDQVSLCKDLIHLQNLLVEINSEGGFIFNHYCVFVLTHGNPSVTKL